MRFFVTFSWRILDRQSLAEIHPQGAPAEVEQALRFIGQKLRRDFVEAPTRIDHDAGFAQERELFGNNVRSVARLRSQFGNHERAAIGQLAQDGPTAKVECAEHRFQWD